LGHLDDVIAELEAKQLEKQQEVDQSDAVKELDSALVYGFDDEEKLIMTESIASFEYFCEHIFAESFENEEFEFKLNWHHRLWCQDVQHNKRVCLLGPRYSLKSTIPGHAFTMWQMLLEHKTFGLYVSYREDLAGHHLEEIKDRIRQNRFYRNFKDTSPQSVSTLRYRVGKRKIKVYKAGVFTSVRGLHPQWVILDDILPDATEKLSTPQELQTIERQFSGVFANLPTKTGNLVVVGTPQDPRDVLHDIKKRKGYKWRKLPAEDGVVLDDDTPYVHEIIKDWGMAAVSAFPFDGKPVDGLKYDCLWFEYDKAWLRQQEEAIKPKTYRREFLLQPASLAESFFQADQIEALIDPDLTFYSKENPYVYEHGEFIVGGMDVGKKQHPTHICIFSKSGETFIQRASIFLEHMEYTWQVEYVNGLIEEFGIDDFYWDNTRAELEDRGLNAEVCHPVSFALRDSESNEERKGKLKMATAFEGVVVRDHIRLLDDEKQKSQILQVRNDLKSASTAEGHGDAFFSIMLAVAASITAKAQPKARIVGDVQDMFKGRREGLLDDQRKLRIPSRWQYSEQVEALQKAAEEAGTTAVDCLNRPIKREVEE